MTLHTKRYRWIDPAICNPPHQVTNERLYCELVHSFMTHGWLPGTPALVGHEWLFDRIQLVSGSHRHAAAMTAGIAIPVVIYSYDELYAIWNSDDWFEWIKNPPTVHVTSTITVPVKKYE